MHASAYLLDDHPEDGDTAGWATVMNRTRGNAGGSAESLGKQLIVIDTCVLCQTDYTGLPDAPSFNMGQ